MSGLTAACLAPPPNRASKMLLGLPRRIDAFGVVAGDEVARAAAGARLQIRQVRLHARDLALDFAALGRRVGAEEQELLVVAAERTGVGAGARELGALRARPPPEAVRRRAGRPRSRPAGARIRRFARKLRQRRKRAISAAIAIPGAKVFQPFVIPAIAAIYRREARARRESLRPAPRRRKAARVRLPDRGANKAKMGRPRPRYLRRLIRAAPSARHSGRPRLPGLRELTSHPAMARPDSSGIRPVQERAISSGVRPGGRMPQERRQCEAPEIGDRPGEPRVAEGVGDVDEFLTEAGRLDKGSLRRQLDRHGGHGAGVGRLGRSRFAAAGSPPFARSAQKGPPRRSATAP